MLSGDWLTKIIEGAFALLLAVVAYFFGQRRSHMLKEREHDQAVEKTLRAEIRTITADNRAEMDRLEAGLKECRQNYFDLEEKNHKQRIELELAYHNQQIEVVDLKRHLKECEIEEKVYSAMQLRMENAEKAREIAEGEGRLLKMEVETLTRSQESMTTALREATRNKSEADAMVRDVLATGVQIVDKVVKADEKSHEIATAPAVVPEGGESEDYQEKGAGS